MNVVRIFPLFLLAAVLSACAAKPARDAGPVASTTVPASDAAAPDVPAASEVSGTAPATADPAVDSTDSDADGVPDATEDDFAALYGTDGVSGGSSASYDPWEKMNRRVHRFNVVVDNAVARPLATAYTNVVPRFARTGVSNFFSNLRSPVTVVNQLLQGRPDDAWDTLGRFLMNSTLGIGGLFDPASKAMVANRKEDFGQTLGAWGWRRSRYVELPFFGPRTVRDVFGLAGDIPLSPIRQVEEDKVRIGLQGLQLVDARSQLLAADDIRSSAVDEYALVRDAWLQRRTYQIENDLRGKHARGNDDLDSPIPVDAMPMPDWGN
ncbi:MlaA family lipoprotein [Stenotrophomonas tumulicola]|uniref:VacJ family lipoprotein n=1 Tax=Stenotrophomonas tumulicola TaxID=1685415 RepID=A0A7W3FQ18_9GAMM|nr:VacJ family lipoprotein [Stenotrophomonas tumulicola]MBA8683649.1 VacJ family lipoprotein [Stenotrophomonas tumulicola]